MNPLPRWVRGALLAAVLLLSGTFLFLSAMDRGLNHDEHQFVAPGVLISREGLLPYRDFPMFHLPNLAFVYAGLDRLTHQPIWSAKVFNALCSTGTVGLIFLLGISRSSPKTLQRRHYWLALGSVLLLLADQLFAYTTGKTWNHELPAFLLVLAILAHVRGLETQQLRWFALSGTAVGLAIGTRLTYAPVALGFPLLLWCSPLPARRRWLATGVWLGACTIALAPTWYFLCADRERFLFDNLTFPRLRLNDPADSRVQKTMTWWRKVRYFVKEILGHSLPLAISFAAAMYAPVTKWIKESKVEPWLLTVVVILPLTVIGCCLPSRYQYQHFFAVAPLMALGIAFALRRSEHRGWYVDAVIGAATLVALSPLNAESGKSAGALKRLRTAFQMIDAQLWFTTKNRAEYTFVVQTVPVGPILTLTPANVLEVGGHTYPEFATGPFAWRAAHLVPGRGARAEGLVGRDDLADFLAVNPPSGILTGTEDDDLEERFVAYAKEHGYREIKGTRRRVLWIPQ